MPHDHERLVETFYRAFQQRDAATMTACYAPTVEFRDPVFHLSGWRAAAMWRMLCERGVDLRIAFGDVRADSTRGTASWEAWYTFSATGRPVHNRVTASFEFGPAGIVRHHDQFSLYRWAAQALGLKGRLLGWTPPVQEAIRRQAARALDGYIARNSLDPASPSSSGPA